MGRKNESECWWTEDATREEKRVTDRGREEEDPGNSTTPTEFSYTYTFCKSTGWKSHLSI